MEVVTSEGVQRQQVGQAEGSIRSQGHYRLYFGLGKQQTVNSVKVFWPDGQLQEIKNPASDQLLVIQQEAKRGTLTHIDNLKSFRGGRFGLV